MKPACMIALFTIFSGAGAASCLELNGAAVSQAASGHLKEAEGLLMSAGAFDDEAGQAACAGHVLSNLAGMMSLTGRMADAERLAEIGPHPGEMVCGG